MNHKKSRLLPFTFCWLLLVSCMVANKPSLSVRDVAGTYVEDSAPKSIVNLHDDGPFRVSHFPLKLPSSPGERDHDAIVDGLGTWSIRPVNAVEGDAIILLTFTSISPAISGTLALEIYFKKNENEIYLLHTIEDPDLGLRHKFKLQAKP